MIAGRAKAAIIVRLMLSEGARLPLETLPARLQTALAAQMADMHPVDRDTVQAVAEEFCAKLDAVGLSFPKGVAGALSLLDGHISQGAADHLRLAVGTHPDADPWDRIGRIEPEKLLPVLSAESAEVAAVILSKIAVSKAAALLGQLPGPTARRIAYAISLTGMVDADTLRRIGESVAGQIETGPVPTFSTGPVERVGAILNVSPAVTRDDVLQGLDETDAAFADQVRKAIFTFTGIPARIDPRDIPKIVRAVDQKVLTTALAASGGTDAASAEFLLANMSQRMAASLRDEIASLGTVKHKDGEAAQAVVVAAIRELEASKELSFLSADDA